MVQELDLRKADVGLPKGRQ